jgi:hypothetical protein
MNAFSLRRSLLLAVTAGLYTLATSAHAQVVASSHVLPTNMPGVYAVTQPPADFNPLTASDAELAEWGYPPRPTANQGPKALAFWTSVVTAPVQRVIPQLKARPGVYHRPLTGLAIRSVSPDGKSTAATSSNWSGVGLIPATGGEPFYLVEARWVVPTVKQAPGTCSRGWDYSSEWVGLGGFSDAYLFQAGSAANVYCDIGGNIPEYFPWVEWLPASELVIYKDAATGTLYPFQAGDIVVVEVWATNFVSGVSKTGNMLFEDVTQGWSVSLSGVSAASLGGSEVTGKSAEWIVERTQVDGQLATLPDYIADAFEGTAAVDLGKAAHYPGASGTASEYSITMLDNSGEAESYVDVFGSNALWFFPEGSASK